MDVLVYLALRPGSVISKEELKRTVWKREYVVDEAVKRCISQIRKAFRDNPSSPTTIETVRKRGYRLIAHVQTDAKIAGKANIRWLAAATAIFALLFVPSATYLSDFGKAASAIPDSLDLHSIARGQYFRYDSDGIVSAIELYEFLITKDSEDAAAYAGLADSLMQAYLRLGSEESIAAKARIAALRSQQLDPNRPEAHKALGSYYHFRGERQLALKSYADAIRVDPTYWMALNNGAEIFRDFGEYPAARNLFKCALLTSPNKIDVLLSLAELEIRDGRHDAAQDILNSVMVLEPDNSEMKSLLADLRIDSAAATLLAGNASQTGSDSESGSWPETGPDSSEGGALVSELASEFRALSCRQHSS